MSETESDAQFTQRYIALVEDIARSVQAQTGAANIDHADLVSCGLVGLYEARARYDASRGVQFSTFAYYRIRGAVIDGLSKMARVPRSVVRSARLIERMDDEAQTAGEQPAGHDPARHAVDLLGTVLSRAATAYVLTALGPEPSNPERETERAESTSAVRRAAAALPERERKVIVGYYLDERPLDDIAAELGMSKSWASRVHSRALDMLRVALGGEPDDADAADTD